MVAGHQSQQQTFYHTVMDGCLLWGRRIIVPQKLQDMLLAELYANHIGMSRMKALARSYIWWPQLNTCIGETCCKYNECLLSSNNTGTAPLHPWLVLKQPWERVHIDHATWGKHLLLVATDVFSKWPKVLLVSSTSAQQTIEKLCAAGLHSLQWNSNNSWMLMG